MWLLLLCWIFGHDDEVAVDYGELGSIYVCRRCFRADEHVYADNVKEKE